MFPLLFKEACLPSTRSLMRSAERIPPVHAQFFLFQKLAKFLPAQHVRHDHIACASRIALPRLLRRADRNNDRAAAFLLPQVIKERETDPDVRNGGNDEARFFNPAFGKEIDVTNVPVHHGLAVRGELLHDARVEIYDEVRQLHGADGGQRGLPDAVVTQERHLGARLAASPTMVAKERCSAGRWPSATPAPSTMNENSEIWATVVPARNPVRG
ncbi:MAG: hypothetical protein UY77_C0034G0012 [Candidatus Uhrbacteria bacterium GW2011_GWA2_53_10]|uniref:Uncharacterized protein n=1 Tax=Candidatus Uhrbacteria bacterium GW2011_GWA2_53_10 TaxID=1618980 RepID=A0A0G1ZUZ4_9BACT|nr:MAG: hypothetical protein UY77_C0034G0012 [Candidatus Uhrbacteria bacterium GW2011_GWA2_53_10]